MAANKEIRVLKTNTLEEFRNKTNDIGLHLGDNEQLSSQLADKVTTYVDVSAGANVFLSTPRFEYKAEESVDNTAGYIILKDVSSITGYANGATVTQSGGYSATVVHATTEKILVKNSSGVFNASQDLSDGSNTIANAKVIRLVTEAYPKGLLRVYKNNVEVDQGLDADEFHVLNLIGKIALTGSPDVSDVVEGTVLNQAGGFQGTVLRARSNELLFKAISGSFNTGQVLKYTTTEEGASIGDTAIASNKLSGSFITYDTARGNAIELNTPAAANDDIKIFSANLVDALNELQHDIGSVESLTTTATTLQGAINEHDAELGTITAAALGTTASTVSTAIAEHETQIGNVNINSIASGNNTITGALSQLHTEVGSLSLNTSATDLTAAVNEIEAVFDASAKKIISSADFTIDSDDDIILDADGGDIHLKDNTTQFGKLTNGSGHLHISSHGSDNDIQLNGNDGGSIITALQLDMSDAGTAIFNHDVKLSDSGQAIFGDSGDLKIYHDGTKSYISEEGTGGLHIQSDGLGMTFFKSDVSKNMMQLTQFGATIHYDGSVKLTTNAAGVLVTGELEATTLDINGAGDISGNLAVGGNTTVGGNETITGNLTVNGTTVDINANADVSGTMAVGSTLGVTGVTTLGNNLGVTGNVTASGEVEGGSLDINGVADISGNLTIGSLDTSSQHVLGSLNELHTELGDIASLNSTFANDSNLVAALNELQTEVGANSYPAGGPASGLGNVTAAINAINSDIGTTSYSTLSSTISGALAQLHTEVGNVSASNMGTAASNITSAINELHGEINTNATNIASNDTDIASINTNIGSLASLTTSVNTSIVNAINSLEDEVDTTQSNIGTINTNIGTIGSLGTSANSLVLAINELHGEINSNDSDITALTGNGTTTGRLRLDNTGTQTIAGNISFAGSGKTMTFQTGTTLDLSAATLTLGGGGSTLQFNTAFIELDVDSNQQGLKINRSAITGVGGSAPDAELRWNNGNTKNVGWEVVYPNGADNSGLATSIVTFDNAGNLVDGATETGISVGFASNNFTFAVQVDDSTIEVNGSNQLQVKNSGITTAKINNLAVTTGKIAASAVTTAKIADDAVTNAKLQHDHFTVSDGTNTSDIALNDTLTFSGTSGEVTVAENAGTVTIGLPNDVTIAGNLTVSGTTTTLNTANLDIEDKTIRFAKNETTLAGLNGAGLEFGANASKPTILWSNSPARLEVNKLFHGLAGFSGSGADLTSLNATNISSGTINDARLPATISSNITGSSASCTGNAATATQLATSRDIEITGDITATAVSFNGSGGVNLIAGIDANTVGPAEMIVGGTASDGKAIVYQSGAHVYSAISTTDTNTKYEIDTLQSGSNAIIRLTSTGDDAGVTDDITLAAGSNITLTESGDTITIASTQATVNNPAITIGAGALIDVSADNNFTLNQSGAQTINVDVDLTELALETADVEGTDHLVYIDNGTQKKIAFSNVNLSAFDNTASGFTTATGTVSSLSDLSITSTATELNKLDGFTGVVADLNYAKDLKATGVTSAEFNHLDGVTSSIQTQLNSKLTSSSNLNASNISSGTIASARLPNLAVSDFGGAAIQVSSESFSDSDTVLMTAKAIDDRIDSKGFTGNVGDITRVNITAGTGLTGSVNTASGDHTQTIALDHLGIEDLVDPNADRIYFWDDSTTSTKFLTPGDNISITGTNLNVANTNVTTNLTATQSGNTVTVNSSDGTNATIAVASTTNAGVMSTGDKSKLDNIASSATNTLQPAISSDGSTPSLTTGITAAEVRSAIGAGDMTSFTITDPASTNETVGNGDSIGLINGSFVNLSLQGSAGSRSIRADLDSSFVSYKTIQLENSSGSNLASTVADQPQDTLTLKEGNGISLTAHDNDGITIAGQVYTAGNGLSLSGSNQFSLSSNLVGLVDRIGGAGADNYLDLSNVGQFDVVFDGNVDFRFIDGGTFHAENDIIAFSTTISSDAKLKKNIQKVDNALDLVCKLDGVTFDWKDAERGSSAGVIAQNVEEVLPSAVNEIEAIKDNDTYKVVDYNQLSALFIEAIKELKEENNELRAEVEKLKSINSNS